MHPPGVDGRSAYESTGVFSPDGEYLPFASHIVTEGRPEEWLNTAEAAMFQATKKNLYKVLEDSKGKSISTGNEPHGIHLLLVEYGSSDQQVVTGTKKDKWVKDNQGQLIITSGQIIWTLECEKALQDAEQAKKSIRQLKKKWIGYLSKLTTITRSRLTKIERNKVGTSGQ